MTRIGGNISDLQATSQTMDQTGVAATDAGSSAAQFSEAMNAEIEDVCSTLRTHFQSLADELEGVIARASSQLGGADWDGSRYANATDFEQNLRGRVENVLVQTNEGVDRFGIEMRERASGFRDVIEGEFRSIMTSVQDQYDLLGRDASEMAAGLEQLDSGGIR